MAGSFEDLVLISKAFNPLSIQSLNLEHLLSRMMKAREAGEQRKGRGFKGAPQAGTSKPLFLGSSLARSQGGEGG